MTPVADIRTIVLVGAGKLAAALGFELKKKGYTILQVCNRTPEKGITLAKHCGASFTADFKQIDRTADLYILAVSDDAVPGVASRLGKIGGLVVHASGTLDAAVLRPFFKNYGVLYPLQTFPGRNRPDFKDIPVCIEANNKVNCGKLARLASTLSRKCFSFDSAERKMVHLSAVIVSNFPNFLYGMAEEIMTRNGLPFEILHPLILLTAANSGEPGVFSRQTGPAVREDSGVINTHLSLLGDHPEFRKIYKLLTESIINRKKSHDKL